jgi:hypothetical protein
MITTDQADEVLAAIATVTAVRESDCRNDAYYREGDAVTPGVTGGASGRRPRNGDHPSHRVLTGEFNGVARPSEATDLLLRWRVRRECRRRGGHWWHPLSGHPVDWFCCACGVLTDGSPRDGARR